MCFSWVLRILESRISPKGLTSGQPRISVVDACSLDVDVSECELTGDLQVDQGVVLKLSCRPSRSGITKQLYLGLGVIYKLGAVLANKVLEYPDASGHISTFKARVKRFERLGR